MATHQPFNQVQWSDSIIPGFMCLSATKKKAKQKESSLSANSICEVPLEGIETPSGGTNLKKLFVWIFFVCVWGGGGGGGGGAGVLLFVCLFFVVVVFFFVFFFFLFCFVFSSLPQGTTLSCFWKWKTWTRVVRIHTSTYYHICTVGHVS